MSWIERIKLENKKRFLELCHKQNDKYKIPKELKEAEYPFLRKDRNKVYKRQNKNIQMNLVKSWNKYINIWMMNIT